MTKRIESLDIAAFKDRQNRETGKGKCIFIQLFMYKVYKIFYICTGSYLIDDPIYTPHSHPHPVAHALAPQGTSMSARKFYVKMKSL